MAQSNSIQLFGFSQQDRSAKVRWLLAELEVSHENVWIDPSGVPGDDQEESQREAQEFAQLSPLGRAPVLVIPKRFLPGSWNTAPNSPRLVLIESGAICVLVADLFSPGKLAPLPQSPERAEYMQWMFFASSTLDPFAGRIMIIEDIPPGELYSSKFGPLLEDLKDALAYVNSALSLKPAGKRFVMGDQFSAADIAVSFHILHLSLWPEFGEAFKGLTFLEEYLGNMRVRAGKRLPELFS